MNEETVDRMDVMPAQHRDGGAAGLVARPTGPTPTEGFEEEYQKIGRWKGPYATPEARASQQEFWRARGLEGIRWLARRLRQEWHLDALHGAASLLADLGEPIVVPVLEELARDPPHDQALCLLWALVSLSESSPTLRIEPGPFEPILADRLADDDPDIREATAEALRLLGPERSPRWLERRLRDEADEEVRRTIERELARQRGGRS
jgi:hypothetical protein